MRAAFRIFSSVSVLALCGAHTTMAQAKASAEIGTLVGVTVLSASGGGGTLTHVGIPGDGVQASPTIYATFFASPAVMIEPQAAFSLLSSGGSTLTSFGVALQAGYLFTPSQPGSAYVAANGTFQGQEQRGDTPGWSVPPMVFGLLRSERDRVRLGVWCYVLRTTDDKPAKAQPCRALS